MKKLDTLLLLLVMMIFATQVAKAQNREWNDPNSLPIWMTPEEELRKDEIGKGMTDAPSIRGDVKNIAEFERMEGVLVRYPLGLPTSFIADLSQHTVVYTLVSSSYYESQAQSAYQNAGANMSNCDFIRASTDSYWTRDYGPWWVIDENNDVAVMDFPYNRPRPNDNAVNGEVANFFNVPIYSMNVVHTGGNYMTDGYGIAASTELVYEENNNNQSWVNQQMQTSLGIDTYHVTIDPLGEYIKHIDCWGKFLDVDKVLIGEVPSYDSRYDDYEFLANYYANQTSAYGTPYQVFRVYSPNDQPYTNSLIINKHVYVPITNSSWDDDAIQVYEDAMPGYTVQGVYYSSWQNTDALHCRIKGLADQEMLYIKHIPIVGTHDYQSTFEVTADIIPTSGLPLKTDSLFVIYKSNLAADYDTVALVNLTGDTYKGDIPVTPGTTEISYYLFAADNFGKRENHPLIGEPDPHIFNVNLPAVNVDFTESTTEASIGEVITFTDISTGGPFSSWAWDFGSGAVPATANTEGPHDVYYTTSGYKSVSLTIDGIYTKTKSNYITVTVPVTGVSVSPESASLSVGETLQITETVAPSNASDKSVTWASSNGSVATVSSSGLVTATGEGSAVITVTTNDGGFTATCNVIVTIPVTGVSLTPENASLLIFESLQLTETVFPTNASDKSVSWSSSNSSVATVNPSGLVSAVGGGSAIITVTTNDGGFTATCDIVVTIPVSGVSVAPETASLIEGETLQLTENVTPANATNKSVAWSSDNTSVATVNSTGLVTAVGGGSATITVTTNDGGYTATSLVNVTVPVTGVSVSPENASLYEGEAISLVATVLPEDATDKSVTWSSSNTSVAQVDGFGNVSAVSGGSATITVTTNDGGFTASCFITVNVHVSGVTVSPTSLDLLLNDTYQLTETVLPANATDKSVTWGSNNTSVATVNSSGLVTAVGGGSATITVTTNDGGFIASCFVTVTVPVDGVSLNQTAAVLLNDETLQLVETVTPANATDKSVSWASSDPAVATVTQTGFVTAVAEGNTIITVTTNDGGFTATCDISVYAPVAVTGVEVSPESAALDINETLQLIETVLPVNAEDKSVTWSSDNTAVAVVNSSGLVTAVGEGTAIITVTTNDGGFTATCEVTVTIPVTGVTVSPETATLIAGNTEQLTATITPLNATDQSITWISSNTAIATVDADGLVTGVDGGEATITVITNDGGFTATSIITVEVPVTGVTLAPSSLDLLLDETYQLTETVLPANATDKSVTWSSTNTSIATVNSTGLVTAVGDGSATITVTTNDGGFTASCFVTVTVPVDGVSLNQTAAVLLTDETLQLIETVTPANATDKLVSWASSDPAIATVTQTGFVTALAEGNTIITVTTNDGGFTATCDVSVYAPVAVTGVEVSPESAALDINETLQLVETVLPVNAEDKSVTWSSDNTAVATVNSSGLVTAVGEGTAIITVTTNDGGFTATCEITVTIPVTGVTVSPETATLIAGNTEQLTATITPLNATDQSITWISSNTAIATVDADGLVTGVDGGEATITVITNDGGFIATSIITVQVPVAGVTLSPTSLDLLLNDTHQLTETVLPANATNKSVAWSSNNTAVATVNSTGLITAVGDGSATITVTTNDGGFTASCLVTVTVPVTGVSVSPENKALVVGESVSLIATVLPEDATDKSVSWNSSNSSVAQVDGFGNVTAVGGGAATITVTTNDGGFTANCFVTVTVPVTGVTLDQTSAVLVPGSTLQLTETVSPANATNKAVNWSSDNYSVATVNSTGLVTAVGGGSAIITVTTVDGGFTAICDISVPVVDFFASSTSVNIDEKVTFTDASVGGSFSSWSWDFGEDASPATATGQGPHEVSYTSSGNKTVSLLVDGTYSEVKTNYISVSEPITSASATYYYGDIPTDDSFTSLSSSSDCPGVLSVDIPYGAVIFAVDVTYQMTAENWGWFEDQRSQLRCVSPGGTSESSLHEISGNYGGTYTYERTGLDIANGVTGGGTIEFELHAGRVWSSYGHSGCDTYNNRVDNNTWTVTVHFSGDYEPVTGIEVTPESATILLNETLVLDADILPSDATINDVTWSSSDNGVASVNSDGVVTANGGGQAVITVTTVDGGFTATSTITVLVPVTGVSVDPEFVSMPPGDDVQLTASVQPSNANNQTVFWSSSDNAVATVDNNGLVSAISVGTAFITVVTEDGGFGATCEINVNEEACAYENINYEDFEGGWGIWNDGGGDSYRISSYANSGIYSIRLRDNSHSSVMTTDNLDLSNYDEITVDFSYYPVSMDNSNEDFWLQISTNGGSSFTTVEEWNEGDEFENNNRYYDVVVISGPFTSSTSLRFRCDASGNYDWVYIDDVWITGCLQSRGDGVVVKTENENPQQLLTNVDDNPVFAPSFNLYPNPTHGQLTIEASEVLDEMVRISVYSFTGQLVLQEYRRFDVSHSINLKHLVKGLCIVRIETGDAVINKRIMVE